MTARARSRLIVVSNRLPVVAVPTAAGGYRLDAASGGLVTALGPVMRDRGGVWIGWPGVSGSDPGMLRQLAAVARRSSFQVAPVCLTDEERDGFYHGFANEVIWPLFHDLQSLCHFDPEYWGAYQSVSEKYADAVVGQAGEGDLVWVHDYQLMGVGAALRRRETEANTAFFLHIPFPAPDIFMKLPWREPIIRSLLDFDTLGFQSPRDCKNFADCVREILPETRVGGRGQALTRFRLESREVRAGCFPIGIDFNDFFRRAAAAPITARATELRGLRSHRQLLLGIDRLDYTKGIPERLAAFGNALERYPALRGRVTLVQVVVPSRADIPKYRELRSHIENIVGQINGSFTIPGEWVPIHYIFRSLSQEELLAYYRASQIALITPLKDGMNLVAKEYCACSLDEDCVLVLSEFAGAAAEMRDAALLVNPYDLEGVADAINRAFNMPLKERRGRMRRLRRIVCRHDVFWWAETFLAVATARKPHATLTRRNRERARADTP